MIRKVFFVSQLAKRATCFTCGLQTDDIGDRCKKCIQKYVIGI